MARKKKEYKELLPHSVYVKRSNTLITSAMNATLLERKLFAMAMSHFVSQDLDDAVIGDHGELISIMTTSEIRKALNFRGHYMYEWLKSLNVKAMQHSLIMEEKDPVTGNRTFEITNIITNVKYSEGEGKLYIAFNPLLKNHAFDVKTKFTITSLNTLLNFSSNNSFRIYEILSTHIYKIPKEEGAQIEVIYPLNELKARIGLINIDDEKVQDARRRGKSYDYIMENIVKDPPYKDYSNFRRRVLDVAQKEINASPFSEFTFEYHPQKSGPGGKVTGIIFAMQRRLQSKPAILSIEMKNEELDELRSISGYSLADEDIAMLFQHAKKDFSLIKATMKKAYADHRIKNKVGWMIRALDEQWKFDTGHSEPSVSKTGFSNFTERTYDYDELQRQLVQQSIVEEADGQISYDMAESSDSQISPPENPAETRKSVSLDEIQDLDMRKKILLTMQEFHLTQEDPIIQALIRKAL